MIRSKNWLLSVVLLAWLAAANVVSAEPITSIDGTVGSFSLSSNGSTATLTFPVSAANFVTQLNGSPVGPYSPTSFVSLMLNATPIAGAPGGTTFAFSPVSYPGGETAGGLPGGSATFDLHMLTAFVPNALPNTILLSGLDWLTGNSSSLDLSPFLNGGGMTFTLNVGPGAGDFVNLIEDGGRTTGSGSFSQVAQDAHTPEPASLALWGAAAMAGLCVCRRRKTVTA